ncbi:TonB-dependent Receptor Plug Domain [Colwellia chukchiensis]|uniref:TonB-dependent Receptor Plug Domain n=1 Tax=Colwellia chukchiensis TaxID=641665 RepID=A0A1H7GNU8_9GAMM|nr:TonB-dependent receptor [Colwellia chukchiensis]SEK38662.1 TonB-dependent Receptor Plug Domain [Colwellia chukchiensis]
MLSNRTLLKPTNLALALSTSAALTLAPSALVLAQDSVDEVERIEVTGSRIKRTDLETPVPITVIGRTDILAMGAINVADVLNTSPVAVAGSDQSNTSFTNSSVGLNTTALRNLQEERTLVLVNGRRFVSGVSPSVGYAVDLNAIPAAMIERIEILKSASSAIYGTDAVAGVINIITRKDFEGVEVNLQTGISDESDREKYAINITAGNTWDTGSVTMAFGYDEDKGLKSSDRPFSAVDRATILDDNGNEVIGDIFSSFPPQGRIGGTASGYNGDGTPFNGAAGFAGDRFNRADYRQLVTPLERKYVAMNFNQEIGEDINFFTEMNWNSTKTNNSTIEPYALTVHDDIWFNDRGGNGGMSVMSPLLPALLRDNLIADGVSDLNEVGFRRRMVEFGPRSTDLERSTIRVASGFDWNIDDNWNLNTYISWGQTDQTQQNGGQVNVERAALALDVELADDGTLQCVDELARLQGCVPLNMFGANTISDAAVAYVRSPAKVAGRVEQFVFAASVTGELPFELSGGNVAVAFGAEHRLEKGAFSPGDLAQTGASSTNKSEATNGSFYSNDIFAEAILPVTDEFEVDVAVRFSDHEIVGEATTWNLGLQYQPTDELMFRASAATAIRNPNVADLFGGRGETFAGVTDPCNGITAASTSQEAINCLSIPSIAARVAANGSFELTQIEAQSAGGTIGGSPDIQEETADTWSAGLVWQIMDGLSMTVDYYDISIEDAIDTTSRTTVLNRCYAVSSAEFSPNCNGATVRDANGALTEVNSGTSNENNIETSGIDIEFNYTVEVGPGTLKADLIWNHTREWIQTAIEDGSSVDFAGEVLNPDNRANLNLNYALEDLSFSWRMRYWDKSVDSVEGDNFNFTDFEPLEAANIYPSMVYHDISANYHVAENIELSLNIRNLFDKKPPFAGQGHDKGGTGINTVSEAFDVTGRYFQASITSKF